MCVCSIDYCDFDLNKSIPLCITDLEGEVPGSSECNVILDRFLL